MPLLPFERSGMATVDHPTFPLFEVDPQPQLYADIVGIEVVALIGEEVVSREGQKDIRINRKVVLHKPFETNPWPEDEGRIIVAEAGFDKLRPKVRPSVGDRPAVQERQGGDVEFRKGPEPVARELIKIARYFGKPSNLQIILWKIPKAATEIQYSTAFLLNIEGAGQAEFLRPALEQRALRHRAPRPAESHRYDTHTEQLFHRFPPRILMHGVKSDQGERVYLSPWYGTW
jgi:hypothetical protein